MATLSHERFNEKAWELIESNGQGDSLESTRQFCIASLREIITLMQQESEVIVLPVHDKYKELNRRIGANIEAVSGFTIGQRISVEGEMPFTPYDSTSYHRRAYVDTDERIEGDVREIRVNPTDSDNYALITMYLGSVELLIPDSSSIQLPGVSGVSINIQGEYAANKLRTAVIRESTINRRTTS